MRIAQLSTNMETTPPTGYGGTELIVHLLTEGLLQRGHDVTLFATGDSVTSGTLISVCDQPLRTSKEPAGRWSAFDIRLLMKLEAMQKEFDVIHNHLGWQALPVLSRFKCPVITTNHNPVKDYVEDIYLNYRDMPFVAISNAYKKLNFADKLNYVGVVYNGIDTALFAPKISTKRDYLLFVGRLGRDKGAREAIDIARALKIPLKLAGKLDEKDEEFIAKEIQPRLQEDGVEFLGEVDFKQKVDLYQSAIAVVYPINFEEPFGLVMAESLASGTPVMAFDRGSVREIISDGETGIVGRNIEELIQRFPEVRKLKGETCIERAQKLFDVRNMTDGYESLYSSIVNSVAASV